MLEAVAEKLEWENPEVLQTIKGSELEYMVANIHSMTVKL